MLLVEISKQNTAWNGVDKYPENWQSVQQTDAVYKCVELAVFSSIRSIISWSSEFLWLVVKLRRKAWQMFIFVVEALSYQVSFSPENFYCITFLPLLSLDRDSFPFDQQFNILMRFIVDQTQTPNLKVSIKSLFTKASTWLSYLVMSGQVYHKA